MEYVEGTALNGGSRFCFGCEQLGGTDWGDIDIDELNAAVELALARGVNFFDTAAVYGLGLSERRLSKALGPLRLRAMIATKGGLVFDEPSDGARAEVHRDASPAALKAGIASSIERLGLESLPIFYIHWPDAGTPISETMAALMSLKESGRIGSIGLSNFDRTQILDACALGDVDVVQISFSLLSREHKAVIELCSQKNIPVCAYGVLAQGLLTGKYDKHSEFGEEDRRHRLEQFSPDKLEENLSIVERVTKLAREADRAPAQIAIRYALQFPGITAVVVGVKTRIQLMECIDVFDWKLSQSQLAFLEGSSA